MPHKKVNLRDILESSYPGIHHLIRRRECMIILLDGSGIIKELLTDAFSTTTDRYFQDLTGRPVSRYFSMPAFASLKEIAVPLRPTVSGTSRVNLFNDKGRFFSMNRYEKFDVFNAFYTRIPFSALFVRHLPGLGYFGLVQFSDIAHKMFYLNQSGVVFLDGQGRVAGANQRLLDSLGMDADRVLNQPAEKVLSRNPMDLVSVDPAQFELARREKWQDTGDVWKQKRGWIWTPAASKEGVLKFPEPLNLRETDFKLEINCTIKGGPAPHFLVNCHPALEHGFPDFNGYLFGPDDTHENYIVKKRGNIIYRAGPAADL